MSDNVFMEDGAQLEFTEYLNYDANGRGNLGDERPVMVYRMLEFSLKDEIIRRFGKEEQIDIFRKAGRKAGEHFTRQH